MTANWFIGCWIYKVSTLLRIFLSNWLLNLFTKKKTHLVLYAESYFLHSFMQSDCVTLLKGLILTYICQQVARQMSQTYCPIKFMCSYSMKAKSLRILVPSYFRHIIHQSIFLVVYHLFPNVTFTAVVMLVHYYICFFMTTSENLFLWSKREKWLLLPWQILNKKKAWMLTNSGLWVWSS